MIFLLIVCIITYRKTPYLVPGATCNCNRKFLKFFWESRKGILDQDNLPKNFYFHGTTMHTFTPKKIWVWVSYKHPKPKNVGYETQNPIILDMISKQKPKGLVSYPNFLGFMGLGLGFIPTLFGFWVWV